MSEELISSHHFNCGGVTPLNEKKANEKLLPIIVNVYRCGITEVLCHALTKQKTCQANENGGQSKCTYVKEPDPILRKIKNLDLPLSEILNTDHIRVLTEIVRNGHERKVFCDVETLGDILEIDFELIAKSFNETQLKALLIELRRRDLKLRTKISKEECPKYYKDHVIVGSRFKKDLLIIIDAVVDFESISREPSSNSS